jgi:hypothetical protein
MVPRQFAALDNEAFVVDPSSPNLAAGSPIINNSSTPVGTIFSFTGGFEYRSIVLEDTSSQPDIFNEDRSGEHQITEGRSLVANGTQIESESYHFLRGWMMLEIRPVRPSRSTSFHRMARPKISGAWRLTPSCRPACATSKSAGPTMAIQKTKASCPALRWGPWCLRPTALLRLRTSPLAIMS